MKQFLSDKAVYRTAPATQDLLIIECKGVWSTAPATPDLLIIEFKVVWRTATATPDLLKIPILRELVIISLVLDTNLEKDLLLWNFKI